MVLAYARHPMPGILGVSRKNIFAYAHFSL